jgi:tetratricopeptide (TPR) repeat protein
MRRTSSFAVFRFDPGEQDLAKPRWLAREGKLAEAEDEYRRALGSNPDLYTGWLELFELLRRGGRHQDGLELADAAERHWGPDAAMPHTLRGAALVELGRLGEGIGALQKAIGADDAFALAWHEYGYASYRAGHHSEALLALDRAFALEPHTDTLMLRGRILREGGRFDAAEVAFQGALQSTEHDVPRRDAEREIAATRRAAVLSGKRPREFTAREQWFARSGGVLLTAAGPAAPPADTAAVALGSLVALSGALDWRPAAVAGALEGDEELARTVADALGVQLLGAAALDPADRPLVVTVVNDGRDGWGKQLDRLARWRSGYAFALYEPEGAAEPADVTGVGTEPAEHERTWVLDALRGARPSGEAADPEALALARQPLAAWQVRAAPPAPR